MDAPVLYSTDLWSFITGLLFLGSMVFFFVDAQKQGVSRWWGIALVLLWIYFFPSYITKRKVKKGDSVQSALWAVYFLSLLATVLGFFGPYLWRRGFGSFGEFCTFGFLVSLLVALWFTPLLSAVERVVLVRFYPRGEAASSTGALILSFIACWVFAMFNAFQNTYLGGFVFVGLQTFSLFLFRKAFLKRVAELPATEDVGVRTLPIRGVPHDNRSQNISRTLSSTINVSCPQCHAALRVSGMQRGKQILCPKCKTRITATDSEDAILAEPTSAGDVTTRAAPEK